MKKLFLLLLLTSCGEFEPKFKVGTYVKHIQSKCIAVVSTTLEYGSNAGNVLLDGYVCDVENGTYKYLKLPYFETHESNLKKIDGVEIVKYNKSLSAFAKRELENEKNKTK